MKTVCLTILTAHILFCDNSAFAYKASYSNKVYTDTTGTETIGTNNSPVSQKEQQADYLVEVWSHTDDMKPKELVNLMSELINDLRKKSENKNLKAQLDALKGLHDQFQKEIPGFGGDQPNVCDWKDRLASIISGIAPYSEIEEYENFTGVTIGTGTEKSRKGVYGILETAQKTKGVFNEVAANTYMLTGSTAGFSTLGKANAIVGAAEGVAKTINTGKELLGKVAKACKEGPNIKDIQHGIHSNAQAVSQPPQSNGIQSKITIKNITYEQLSPLEATIKKISGVTSFIREDFTDSIVSITVNHNLKLSELTDQIVALNAGVKLTVTGMNDKSGAAILTLKP